MRKPTRRVTVIAAAIAWAGAAGIPAQAWSAAPGVSAQARAQASVGARAPETDLPGVPVWIATHGGSRGPYHQVGGMALSPDGSTVYLAATSDGRLAVAAYDAATGDQRWGVRTSAPGGAQVFAGPIAAGPDGTHLFVTGQVEESVDTRSTLTVAYDAADGAVAWSSLLSAGPHREAIPRRIAVAPDGTRVFVAGSRTGTHGVDDFWDYFTASLAAADGSRQWTATYDGRHGGDTAEGLGVSGDGSKVFVTGTSQRSGDDRDLVTIAYGASDGSRRWLARDDVGADDFATALAVSPDGSRLFVAGFGRPSLAVPHGYRIVAYDPATGASLGAASYSDGRDDMAVDVAVGGDGARVFVTGSNGQDYLTVGYPVSLDHLLWAARYDGRDQFDRAEAVTASPDGSRVYVTGLSELRGVACFEDVHSALNTTVAYNAGAGGRRWVSSYAGAARDPDEGVAAAVSHDGRLVFVAGNSDFGCQSSGVAVLALQA